MRSLGCHKNGWGSMGVFICSEDCVPVMFINNLKIIQIGNNKELHISILHNQGQ